jgi:hypothetical protein
MLRTRLTLMPGANGTKKLTERYGERLVCVRYRYDREKGRRIKTVELIEEESPWQASAGLYLVQIAWDETALRERIKASGGRWNAGRKVWIVSGRSVRDLSLQDRVVGWLDAE